MKLHDPPALALILSTLGAVFFWLLNAHWTIVVGTITCGIAYFLFYLVVEPHSD
jgi:hypothetical protein